MGGDRRRTTSHSIEVPFSLTPQNNSRKRPQPYTHDCFSGQCGDKEEMEECHAAMILMKLSHSPKNAEKWFSSSPGSTSSSGSSWSSGSSSPPLSDDGNAGLHTTTVMLSDANARIRTTSVSTSDEGIVVDFKEEAPRKKRVSPFEVNAHVQQIGSQLITNKSRFRCTWKGCKHIEHTPKKIERHIRNVHLGNKKARRSADCDESCSDNDHEEEFYYTEIEDDDEDSKTTTSPTSPPTLSHRDMARPPHEDPEYQRKIVGTFKQGRVTQQQQLQHSQGQHINSNKTVFHGGTYINNNSSQNNQQMHNNCVSNSPLAHHNYWQSSSVPIATAVQSATSPVVSNSSQQQTQPQYIKHARSSPRPSQSTAPYPSPTYHHNYSSSPNACISSTNSVNVNTNGCNNSQNNSIINNNNSSANNMLHQLSQQNITVTAHHNGAQQIQQQQQQHHQQVPAVTITPNYPNHQQQQQSQQQLQHIHNHQQTAHTNAAGTIVTLSTAQIHHSPQQQQQTSQHHQQPHSHHITTATTPKHTPNSPNRRTRGENKKCRKVYGMERRDQWCTQCRWKKACSRFGD